MASNETSTITSPKLPPEIVLEIFFHLPSESLHRLRCILDDNFPSFAKSLDTFEFQHEHASKEMNKLTNVRVIVEEYGYSHSNLMHEIYPSSNNNNETVLITRTHDFKQLIRDILPKESKTLDGHSVLGSSNGLICVYYEFYRLLKPKNTATCRGCCVPRKRFCYFVLWNPLTGDHHFLPKPKKGFRRLNIFGNLIGAPRTKYGFGYDVVNKTYKLVMGEFRATQIYDLSGNKWKKVDKIDIDWDSYELNGSYSRQSKSQFGYYLNGALHWVTSKEIIVTIDLSTETSSAINMPHGFCGEEYRLNIGGVKGCLSISCYNHSTKKVGIWVMEEYGREESWTNLFTVTLGKSDVDLGWADSVVIRPPLWVSSDDENEALFVFGGKLAYWNCKTEKFRFIEGLKLVSNFREIVHVDTLVSPKPKLYRSVVDGNDKALVTP